MEEESDKSVASLKQQWTFCPPLKYSPESFNLKPIAGTTSTHIQSICDAMEIPHIETRWDFMVRRDDYSINLYPNPKVISKVR